MATTKSTVLGIRIDHDRRAWIEAEAARRGLSVRALFESMIDGARAGETSEPTTGGGVAEMDPAPSSGTATDAVSSAPRAEGTESAAPPYGVNASGRGPGSSPWPDFGSVVALPGGVIRGALSLTTGLINSSTRCARRSLGDCALTRHWVGHTE